MTTCVLNGDIFSTLTTPLFSRFLIASEKSALAPAPSKSDSVFDRDTTSDPQYQAYYWTKTHLVPRPPPQPLRGHVDLQQLEENIKRAVKFARLYESPSEDDPQLPEWFSLRIMLSNTTASPQLSDAHIDATWWCGQSCWLSKVNQEHFYPRNDLSRFCSIVTQ